MWRGRIPKFFIGSKQHKKHSNSQHEHAARHGWQKIEEPFGFEDIRQLSRFYQETGIPTALDETLQNMKPGEISAVLRSPNAFHIIKLLNKRSTDTPVVITQTHARHILIKTSELTSESEARSRLAEIKRRIEGGADFAAQAKLYSEDGSAAQGGDLGWVSPGVFVPEFERAMNALKVGQISDLVQTEFGWHLIQVIERRNADVSVEQKKQQASAAIRSFKSDEAYQEWLRQLRDRAFVEYRNATAK